MDEQQYPITVKEVSERLGTSSQIIRRICNLGLIPHLRRSLRQYRLFDQQQVELLYILINMKKCGFKNKELRKFSWLYRQGDKTMPERVAILTTKKHQLQQEIWALRESVDFIEKIEEIYQQSR